MCEPGNDGVRHPDIHAAKLHAVPCGLLVGSTENTVRVSDAAEVAESQGSNARIILPIPGGNKREIGDVAEFARTLRVMPRRR